MSISPDQPDQGWVFDETNSLVPALEHKRDETSSMEKWAGAIAGLTMTLLILTFFALLWKVLFF